MPTIFDNLTTIPESFVAGEVVTWVETLDLYPGATHSVAYKFAGQTPMDGFQQFGITGTESATAVYTFATPSAPKPGIYTWDKQITLTSGSVMRSIECGKIIVRPNPATALTTTTAQTMVTTLETAIATLSASTNQSVSFNGQSYSKANINTYRSDLVYWQAQVIKERAALAALNCCTPNNAGRVANSFLWQ